MPVIAVDRRGDAAIAMDVMDSRKADFVALGRSLIADPEYVIKAQHGCGRPPLPCVQCNTCVDDMRAGNRLGCTTSVPLPIRP